MIFDGIMADHLNTGQPRAGMLHPNTLWADGEDRTLPPDWVALKDRLAMLFEKRPDEYWYTNIEHLPLPNPWVEGRPEPDSERAELSRDMIRDFGLCVQDMIGGRYLGNFGGVASLGLNRHADGLDKVLPSWNSWLTGRSETGLEHEAGPFSETGVGVMNHYYRHASRSIWTANAVITADWWRQQLPDVIWTGFISPWNYQQNEAIEVRTFSLCFAVAQATYDNVVIWDHPDRTWDDISEHINTVLV
jgi:hypothetical protein